ncbi:hypothetical protein Q3G72_012079 [Acer saccharum]|nr:hypothetical protein Q3G72_012079 [Acer saccharum]
MFEVNAEDGNARLVLLTEELVRADDIAIRKDGVVLVASIHTLWFLKSHDSWGEAVVYDKTALEEEKSATSVAVGDNDRAYVLYGHVIEGIMGNVGREEFSIVEVRSSKDSEDENIWLFVLIGLGLAYFLFWRQLLAFPVSIVIVLSVITKNSVSICQNGYCHRWNFADKFTVLGEDGCEVWFWVMEEVLFEHGTCVYGKENP